MTEDDTNANTLKYCEPPAKEHRIRVDGLGCAQAREWILGVPREKPIRIPALPPGRVHRFQGLVCRSELLEELGPRSGPLEVTCRNEQPDQRLVFVVF